MGDCQERKETRFNLLMGVSFELLTIGQLLGALKYFVLASLLFDYCPARIMCSYQ